MVSSEKDVNKVKDVWKEARKVIKGGIKLQQKLSHDRNGRLIFVYENNFPKSNFNNVAHVRNKAGESEYFCENANSVRLKNGRGYHAKRNSRGIEKYFDTYWRIHDKTMLLV